MSRRPHDRTGRTHRGSKLWQAACIFCEITGFSHADKVHRDIIFKPEFNALWKVLWKPGGTLIVTGWFEGFEGFEGFWETISPSGNMIKISEHPILLYFFK